MIENRNSTQIKLGDQISLGGYIFDAYLRISHSRKLTITQHPVESGASISDHAFVEPITFELDIGMTDTTSGKIPSQFDSLNLPESSTKSRSIKAYDLLVNMQNTRIPYEFICRYGIFNVVVEEITPTDDYTTKYALRASVRLRQIITTEASSTILSGDPYVTDSINRGEQNSKPVEEESVIYSTGLDKKLREW